MNPPRIQIVEDEYIIARGIQMSLENMGYIVSSPVASGEEAIDKAAKETPDLVLMDIMLKGELDGIEAAELIRSRFGIPVIFLTAYANEGKLQKAKQTLPFGYVLKPFRDRELKIVIEMALYAAKIDAERKLAEDKIIRAKQEWERTFDTVPDLIAILDDNYRVVRVNRAMADRLGITPDRAVGLICYEYVHGTKEPPPFCPCKKMMADGREHTVEIYEDNLGGDFLVTASPFHDAEGRLIGCVHVARDITERRQAEEEREKLINELQEALKEIKTLRGILPLCSFCKKIKDDKGYWEKVDVYIYKYSEADISHGICPDCMKKHYPEEYEDIYPTEE